MTEASFAASEPGKYTPLSSNFRQNFVQRSGLAAQDVFLFREGDSLAPLVKDQLAIASLRAAETEQFPMFVLRHSWPAEVTEKTAIQEPT
jgi:hypothetical protein